MTTRNEENQTILIFGDGVTGMRLVKDATLQSSFRFGGGTVGNVAVGLINSIYDTTITNIDSLVNTTASEGGRL
jgi:hypothetical protein